MSACTPKYKLKMVIFFALAYLVLYVLPNYQPPTHPLQLPLFWIDRAIPFLPWTFAIYLSDYLLALTVVVSTHDLESFNSVTRMTFMALLICGTFFLLVPTTYPRPVYPHDEPFLVQSLLNLITFADTPNNCFPSMHVAATGALTWSMRNRSRTTFGFYCLWAIAIYISTLTTKQHYAIDIAGGLGVVVTVVFLEHLLFARNQLRTWLSKLS